MTETPLIHLPPTQADSAWKDVLQCWFPEFMAFFYPDLAKKIDWSMGYETLDKELQALATQAMIGKRFVDKLMKVKSLEGQELFVLLHIEIQGEKETHFEKRLFEYYYRLMDKYNLPIVTLAVLADDNPSWRPCVYQVNVWGDEVMSFRFRCVKLLDYADQKADLEQTTNPFGLIILAQLAAMETKQKPDARFNIKFSLTRQLYDRGLNRDTILSFYKFIDWVLALPEDLEIRYNEKIYQIEEERSMAYITSAERMGMEKGYQQGMQQGTIEGEKLFLTTLLKRRFRSLSPTYLTKIDHADPSKLLLWGEKILDAKKIEDIFDE